MKKIINFIVFSAISISLYIGVDYASEHIFIKYENIQNFDLLIKYAFLIGYIFFIVFVFVIHQDQFTRFKEIKPKMGIGLHISHTMVSLSFLGYVFTVFSIKFSFLMVLFYMLLTTGFDLFVEHKFNTQDTKVIYPKRII